MLTAQHAVVLIYSREASKRADITQFLTEPTTVSLPSTVTWSPNQGLPGP